MEPGDSSPAAAARGSRRRARTRRQLTEAAATLIAEKGVEGLRIQELTDRADVALGSFYNHFESKTDLVEAVVATVIDERAQLIVAHMGRIPDPAEAVSYAARQVIRIAYEDPELARLFVNLDRVDKLFEGMVIQAALRLFEAGIESGRFDIVDSELALTTMVGGALAVMRGILDDRFGEHADETFAMAQLRAMGISTSVAHRLSSLPLATVTSLSRAA